MDRDIFREYGCRRSGFKYHAGNHGGRGAQRKKWNKNWPVDTCLAIMKR